MVSAGTRHFSDITHTKEKAALRFSPEFFVMKLFDKTQLRNERSRTLSWNGVHAQRRIKN